MNIWFCGLLLWASALGAGSDAPTRPPLVIGDHQGQATQSASTDVQQAITPEVAGLQKLYIIRHAEKDSRRGGKNPPLSLKGRRRALGLVDAMAGKQVDRIMTSQFRRTRQTVWPLAQERKIRPQIVGARQFKKILATIRNNRDVASWVIAGHSFTLPRLLRMLGVRRKVRVPSRQYGIIYEVTLKNGQFVDLQLGRFVPRRR